MLRVMLVDDEIIALEGLRLLIDWQAEGFAVCAECTDASQALAALPACKPDLIVTDIRMPDMDGLRLMQEANARGFAGEWVVVSGYGDFEYARKALEIGVAGYLLKPVDAAEASDVLEHVRTRLIARDAARTEAHEGAQRALTFSQDGQAEADCPSPFGLRWRLATWGAPLPYDAVRALLSAFPEGVATAHIVDDREYLLLQWPKEGTEPSLDVAAAQLRVHGRRLMHADVCEDMAQLPARRAALVTRMEAIAALLPDRAAALAHAIAVRDTDECVARSEELERLCLACGADAHAAVRARLIAECASQLAGRPEALSTFLQAQPDSLRAVSLEAVRLLMPEQEQISRRVIVFLEERLAERMTLETVADALGYNPTYLGRLFREEQGLGFRDWLNRARIERAARLLRTTDLTVAAVAEQVGFQHYKRFLEHFKRRYRVPPDRYRKAKNDR